MRCRLVFHSLLFLFLPFFSAQADYLEVRHAATIRTEPSENAQVLSHLTVGTYLRLLDDKQTNGYYKVPDQVSKTSGWIYRTLVRRYPGKPPTAESEAMPTPATNCPTKLEDCPDIGCGGDSELNKLKNRIEKAQNHSPKDWSVTEIAEQPNDTPLGWHRGGDRASIAELGEGTPVSVKGYVYYYRQEGPEACNCNIDRPDSTDIHINLLGHIPEPEDDKSETVVVEITPRLSPEGWSIDKLKALRKNKTYVRVTGWLLFDTMHGASGARATSWEVHPITKFEVCTATAAECGQGTHWTDLETYSPQ